jgi:hypothetical protein
MNIEDTINYFYKKKKLYDKKINEKKKAIRENEDLSIEDKRESYKKIKQACIKCKRNVGTIFKTGNRELIAKCGDESNPCSLDIHVSMGTYEYIPNLMKTINTDLNLSKLNINKIKLDLLFGLSNEEEMEKKFEEMKSTYKSLITSKNVVEKKIDEYNMMEIEEVGNVRVIERRKVAQSQQLLLNNYIQSFRDLIKEYTEDSGADTRRSKLIDAIDIYNNQILVSTKIIREALYDINAIIYEKGKYKLYQIARNPNKMVLETEKPELISNKK